MSQSEVKEPGYEVGKTYKTITRASAVASLLYALVGFIALIQITLTIQGRTQNTNLMPTLIFGAILLALGVMLTFAHFQSPNREFTVVRHFIDHGVSFSEVRYPDGRTDYKPNNDGYTEGFWKQLGRVLKATATGK